MGVRAVLLRLAKQLRTLSPNAGEAPHRAEFFGTEYFLLDDCRRPDANCQIQTDGCQLPTANSYSIPRQRHHKSLERLITEIIGATEQFVRGYHALGNQLKVQHALVAKFPTDKVF